MLFKKKFFQSTALRDLLLILVGVTLFLPLKYNSYCIVLFMLWWLFFVPKVEKLRYFQQNKKLLLLLLSYYLITALSILYSADIKEALIDIEGKLSLFLFPLALLMQQPIKRIELNKILYSFAISSAVFSLITLFLSFYVSSGILANQELAGLIDMHASYFGLYVGLGFFILLEDSVRNKFSLLNSVLLIVLLVMITFLASRIVVGGVFLIGIIWFLFLNFKIRNLLIALLLAVLVAVVSLSYSPIKNRFYETINFDEKVLLDDPEFKAGTTYGGRSLRVALWKCGWDVMKEHWLFGVGTGDDHAALQQSYKERDFVFAWKYNSYNAHNLFMQTIIASGIPGLISLLAIFYFLFSHSVRQKILALFAFVSLFFLISMVESSLNVHKGIVFFALFTSLFASFISQKELGEG